MRCSIELSHKCHLVFLKPRQLVKLCQRAYSHCIKITLNYDMQAVFHDLN